MSIYTKMLRQDAIYWPPTASDDYGKYNSGALVEIKCRWEDATEEFVGKDGRNQISKAKVYVDRDLMVGGILWLGTKQQLKSATSPFDNPGAFEIKSVDKLPNLKATKFLRWVML